MLGQHGIIAGRWGARHAGCRGRERRMGGFALVIQPDEEEPEAAEVLVDGSVGRRPYRFLLDTGAAKSAILSDDYTATFAAVGQHTSSGVFAGGSEDVVIAPTIAVGPIV